MTHATAALHDLAGTGFAGSTRPRSTRAPSLLARLVALMAMGRSRRSLRALDDHLLRDLGLTRREAAAESARPSWDGLASAPWDAPAHWLR